jgi:SAM-dependent methyltransferase
MTITVQNCPLCSGNQSSLFDQRNFRDLVVINRLCSRCGLVFQSPRMPDKELAAFYEQEYRQLYQGSPEPGARDLAIQRQRAESLVAFSRGRIAAVSRHLDIGCSAGLLLEQFQSAYGCQPTGIEPGNDYRSYAQAKGLTAYPSLDALRASNPGQFDLISLAHVLEHLPNPVEFLEGLRRDLLAPEGRLLVEVPNLYAHDSFEVAHLVAFSRFTLTQVLKKAGYEITGYLEHGRPRSRIIPLYISIIAKPSTASYTLVPERGVRQKRKWGLFHRRLVTRLLPRLAWLPQPAT